MCSTASEAIIHLSLRLLGLTLHRILLVNQMIGNRLEVALVSALIIWLGILLVQELIIKVLASTSHILRLSWYGRSLILSHRLH